MGIYQFARLAFMRLIYSLADHGKRMLYVRFRSTRKEDVMPVIHFYGPELPEDKRREIVKGFAETASKATGIPVEKMITYLHEMDADHIGLGGALLPDRVPR